MTGGNPSRFKGDNNPVEQVSWNECRAFVEKAGKGLRLPTEAQWEYACRAGSTELYAGNRPPEEMGGYEANGANTTHLVGKKSPNAWGIYDMHGNVNERCSDL